MKTITILLASFISIFTTANATEISNVEITGTSIITNTISNTINNSVVINWNTKNETNSSRFEVERSFYSNNFSTITSFQISNNANNTNDYRVTDNAAELNERAVVYYRVKQTDANGNSSYSNVTTVNLNNSNKTTSLHSSKNGSSIQFAAMQTGFAKINIKTVTGITVSSLNTIVNKGNNTVELTNMNELSKGIYFAEVSINGTKMEYQKIIVE